MTIKDRIVRILAKKGLSYSILADGFNLRNNTTLTEKDIDNLINEKNIKVMEWISKELGIPLYSFYIDSSKSIPHTNRHYIENIWEED